MSNTNDFSGVKVGDKLWSIQLGECVITNIRDSRYISCCPADDVQLNNWVEYDTSGLELSETSYNQSLFWSKPEIIAPEKPKRKVKKTVETTLVIKHNGEIIDRFNVFEDAENHYGGDNYHLVRCTGEYEVEE